MNMACRLAPWTLAFLSTVPLAADGASEIHVERRDGVFHVRVEVPVAVDVATAWKVLTDYNRLAEFIPDMQSSRIISAPGRPLLLEQKAETWFLLFKFKLEVVLQVEEAPPERLEFRAVGGNMKRMRGEWHVGRADSGVRLGYEAEMEPDFWVPPLLGTTLLRRDIGKQVAGLEQEMLRRHASHLDGTAPRGNDRHSEK